LQFDLAKSDTPRELDNFRQVMPKGWLSASEDKTIRGHGRVLF
jgi:hypothetical protein